MSRLVTVKVVKAPAGQPWRSDARWLPWRWLAFSRNTKGGQVLLAESRFHATRDECLADIHMLFGVDADVEVSEDGAPPWPLRTAVPA